MKHNRIIVLTSFVFLTFLSCKKVIEIKETDFIGGDIALKTVSNNEQGILGAYGAFGIEMAILMNSTLSDEVKTSEFYNAATTHEWQYTSTDISIRDNFTAFHTYYRVIDRVNRVLQALPTADSVKVGDNALRAKLRGEGLFLRAYSHFELFRYYSANYDAAGLALAYMETPTLVNQARINMGPYFDKIKADMAEAKNLLPNNLTDITRANRLSVSGLQARVALYMRDWANAVTFSTEYINAIPLSPMATFNGIWTDANNNELALKLKRTTAQSGVLNVSPTGGVSTSRLGSLYRGTSANASNIGTVTWMPSNKLWDAFDQANDIRFVSYLKHETILANAGRPPRIVQKYAGTGYATAAENVADAKVFRTGEMYLIRAEAKAENNDLVGATLDLNTLRAARISGYTPEVFLSKDALITAVLAERFKELAFEGHRFWDLKRKGLAVSRLTVDAPSAAAATLPAGNFRFQLPIPNAEIQANPLMVQNQGYSN